MSAATETAAEGPALRRRCPACNGAGLAIDQRQGVSIDSCPRCRGIWLDAGELEALVERAARAAGRSRPTDKGSAFPGSALHARRRRSWLEDLFD